MHNPQPSHHQKWVTSFIEIIKVFTFVFTAIAPALLISSCVDPYSSLYGESPTKIKEDVDFLESYKNGICTIKEKHEYEEISRGKCLALYYDYKEQSDIKSTKESVVKRVSQILKDPGKVDQSILDQLSLSTAAIADCKNYITENCMY